MSCGCYGSGALPHGAICGYEVCDIVVFFDHTYLLFLAQNCIDKMQLFHYVLIVLLLMQNCL